MPVVVGVTRIVVNSLGIGKEEGRQDVRYVENSAWVVPPIGPKNHLFYIFLPKENPTWFVP
jgi:hypothetical protein